MSELADMAFVRPLLRILLSALVKLAPCRSDSETDEQDHERWVRRSFEVFSRGWAPLLFLESI
jgi:hypothetical protein